MELIDVDLLFDDDSGEPFLFVNDEANQAWNYEDVLGFDHRETAAIEAATVQLQLKGGDVVQLCDGSDAVFLASTTDMVVL